MMHEWRVLATAIMFLTRIPVGQSGSGEPADLAKSTQYFPAVGVLVGVLVSLVFFLGNFIWNSDIAIVLMLVFAVLLTGGFHEDGLADVADSAGAWTAEHKLDIMRDSRVGTYGALALILVLLLKFVSLSAVAERVDTVAAASVWVLVATVVLAHVLGRWSSLILIRMTPYARKDSANSVLAEGVSNQRVLIGSAITLVVMAACSIALGSVVIYASGLACIAIVLSRHWFLRSVGGITGDCLGAANQLVEVLVYLCVAGFLARIIHETASFH